jgi:hypothetical protein
MDMSAWWKYSWADRTKCTAVPMIFHKSIKTTTTSVHVLNSSPKWSQANQGAKIQLGETPFSIKESMSTQINFQYLVYLFLINFCFNHVFEILSIPSLWKWWMFAMLKLCKNLVHIFMLYAFLNLLVYFETRAWNKNFVGSKCLWPNIGCRLVWYGVNNVGLLYLKVWWNFGWFLFENKTRQVPRWSYYLPKPYVDLNA